MVEERKLPEGYKITEIGIIPEDWELEYIENLCVKNGLVRGPFGGALKKEYFVKYGYKVYEQKNAIYQNDSIGSYYIDERKYNELKRFEVNPGDFIVSCSGTIGKIYQIPESAEKGVINQALLKLNIDKAKIYDKFFYYYFDWEVFQERILDNTQGGAIKNLVGMPIFRKLSIPLPPLHEQQAIAEALSDVDNLITSLEKLIDKKQKIKQGTMQELLTGKRRLPGFTGEWEVKRLNELCEIETGRRPKGGVTEEGDIPSLGGENIYNNDGLNLETVKRVPLEFYKNMKTGILRDMDVLMNKDGANTGKVALYKNANFKQACINEHLFIIRGKNALDNEFLFYMLCTKNMKNQILKQVTSSAQPGLNSKFIYKIFIPIPDIEEQQAIAQVLSDIDSEIEALEQKLEKYKAIKQGMMEELLTGRTRLV